MPALSLLLLVIFAFGGAAQQGAPPSKSAEERMTGTVQTVSPAAAGQATTVTIESGAGHIRHEILCSSSTAITYKGKPSTLSEVKQKRKITCFGTVTGQQFTARRCDVK